jgi:predicted O-methyltransferase YrrM
MIVLPNFKGIQYRLADNWFNIINVNDYNNKPINYLEIGTFYGANIISVGLTYGLHTESKLYCIDPWEDYNEYDEYKNQQPQIYNTFTENIINSGIQDKIIINRGYSNKEINKFDDNFFDIIYIDGNHESYYVLEDAVSSFRKLKVNGIMIFDDYGWYSAHSLEKGVDAFLSVYSKRIQILGIIDHQVFIKKIN